MAEELGVTVECALDIRYIRGRKYFPKHQAEEMERRIILLHKAGTPPRYIQDWIWERWGL